MRSVSLSVLMPFFRTNDPILTQHTRVATSVFSEPDQSELLAQEDEICPLVEAEVYVIYGRQADAEKVLASGVQSGRITAGDVARFWAKQACTIKGKRPD
jgi:hypothetical protein